MPSFPMQPFSGAKFAARYGLDSLAGDFWADENFIYIRDGVNLPDDPPIFEAPDPLITAPPGIRVHTMRQAQGKKGGEFIIDQAESKCIHVLLDTEALLTDPWLMSIPMEQGSAAYCIDTEKQWFWNGTAWKKP